MRVLAIMRGAPGCGKSTFIREQGWTPYTLEPDVLRLQVQAPVLDREGRTMIAQTNDKYVWKLLFEMLDRRMQQGCFTVVDATHTRAADMKRYKELAERYKYRMICVDMSDVPWEVLQQRNEERDPMKRVPDAVLTDMYNRCRTQSVPGKFKVVRPDTVDSMFFRERDLSSYKRVVHVGDIHGCYSALKNFLTEETLREDTFYIFLGDFVDRGTENADVVRFMLSIADRENVILLEGNHEKWLADYGEGRASRSREFELFTRPELHEAGITPKEMRIFCRKLGQCVYYTYGDRKVFVCHGGITHIPGNPIYVNTQQLIHGVGRYGDASQVEKTWDSLMPENHYQIHAHRNTEDLSIHPSDRCYNLEGQVEFGGRLRAVVLSEEGFETFECENPVPRRQGVRERLPNVDSADTEADPSVAEILENMRSNRDIREKKFGNISSFNFTRNVFMDGRWNELTCKARGLYINTLTKNVVARSYDKFFNVNEREETRESVLASSFEFPVTAYVKENGYLGIVGYDFETGELIITSKSDLLGPYACMFREILLGSVSEDVLKEFMRERRSSLIFEVIDPVRDPHIISYDRAHVVLLDEVKNRIEFEKTPYKELVPVAEKLGVAVKRQVCILKNAEALEGWMLKVSGKDFQYRGEYIEGFVLEGVNGFMTKVKLDYYKTWKSLRTASQAILKQGFATRSVSQKSMMVSCFLEWLQTEVYPLRDGDGQYSFATDIVSLRERYLKERGMA